MGTIVGPSPEKAPEMVKRANTLPPSLPEDYQEGSVVPPSGASNRNSQSVPATIARVDDDGLDSIPTSTLSTAILRDFATPMFMEADLNHDGYLGKDLWIMFTHICLSSLSPGCPG